MKTKHKLNLFSACVALSLLTILIAGLISVQPAHSQEWNASIYVGFWTEHYYHDKSYYNEDNRMVEMSVKSPGNVVFASSTFFNSHYKRCNSLAAGYEIQSDRVPGLQYGLMLAAIKGYEGDLKTHYDGLLFMPVSYYKYKAFKLLIAGPVINAGAVFEF